MPQSKSRLWRKDKAPKDEEVPPDQPTVGATGLETTKRSRLSTPRISLDLGRSPYSLLADYGLAGHEGTDTSARSLSLRTSSVKAPSLRTSSVKAPSLRTSSVKTSSLRTPSVKAPSLRAPSIREPPIKAASRLAVSLPTPPHSSSGLSRSSQHSPTSPGTPPDEHPPWDRTIDVAWNRRHKTPDNIEYDYELAFQENCERLAKLYASKSTTAQVSGRQSRDPSRIDRGGYFALDDRVRFKITKYVLAGHDSGKPIRLNGRQFVEPIWPVNPRPPSDGSAGDCRIWTTDHFDSLEEVLQQIQGYTNVSFAMRVDFMAALLITRRFHVVYSPFVTEMTQPAATLFMDRFGPFMKHITLEVDLSKLGGSWEQGAERIDMQGSICRQRDLVKRFADTQLARRGVNTLQDLLILVRRYYGNRPFIEQAEKQEKLPAMSRASGDNAVEFDDDDNITVMAQIQESSVRYCSDEYLSVLDPLKQLGGAVDSFGLSGATMSYGKGLMLAFWGDDLPANPSEFVHQIGPSRWWAWTPGQRSAHSYPGHGVKVVEHPHPMKFRGTNGVALSPNVIVTEKHRQGYPPTYKISTKGSDMAGPKVRALAFSSAKLTPAPPEGAKKKPSFSALFGRKEQSRSKERDMNKRLEPLSPAMNSPSPTSPTYNSPWGSSSSLFAKRDQSRGKDDVQDAKGDVASADSRPFSRDDGGFDCFSKTGQAKGNEQNTPTGKEKNTPKGTEAATPLSSPTQPLRSSPSRLPLPSQRSASGQAGITSSSGSSDTEQESGASSGSGGTPLTLRGKPSQTFRRVIGKGLTFGKKSADKD